MTVVPKEMAKRILSCFNNYDLPFLLLIPK
jgi:hypothetical protein